MGTSIPAATTRWLVCVALCLVSAAVAGERMSLPLRKAFEDRKLDAAWTVDVSKGNTISVSDGTLAISACANTYAHIERPLNVDLVRAGCTLSPGPAVSWVASLFLYWDPGNWCQLSALPHERVFYAVELIQGALNEHRLGPCGSSPWHRAAIELGEDCVRYLSSADGKSWATLRIAERPRSWRGGPPLLIVGKGFSRNEEGHRPFPAPDLDNDYPARGGRTVSRIRDVFVTRTPPGRLRMSQLEKKQVRSAGCDLLGELELAAEGDPSFTSVSRHFPAMKLPREAIGVKDHPHEIAVLPDGSLQFGAARVFFHRGQCTKRLLEGYLPIVIAERELVGLKYEQTALGWSQGMSPGTPLVAYIRLRIANPAQESRTAAVRLQVHQGKSTRTAAAWDVKVAPERDQSVHVKIPFSNPASGAARVAAAEFDQRLAETVAFWDRLLSKGTRIHVPEQRVNDAYRAWLAYNFLNVDKRGSVYEPHDGAGFYEQIYGYSAALYCHALDLMGYHEEAQAYLDSLLTFVAPEGLYVQNYGLPDTGALLLATAEHYGLTADEAWLRTVAPTALRMCRWIIGKRKEVQASQPEDSPLHGLIKFRPYCDHREPAYSYLTDGYLVVGMEAAADALRAAGMADEAARIRNEAGAYRRDIVSSMRLAVLERDGAKILPLFPETHGLLKRVRYTGRDYYSLVAGMLLETGFLPPAGEITRQVTEMMERRGGLLLGMCTFGDGVDHAYTYGYWMDCLQRDQVERVLLGFYGSMAYGMSQETYSAVEVTRLRSGRNAATLPHLYSNTQQLRLLRHMLLREEGDDLIVGQAIPRPWLEHGKQIRVEGAPTCFGKVSFTIDSRADEGKMMVQLDPPTRRAPRTVKLRLRHPKRARISEVRVDGRPSTDFGMDTIRLSGPKGRTSIEARFR